MMPTIIGLLKCDRTLFNRLKSTARHPAFPRPVSRRDRVVRVSAFVT